MREHVKNLVVGCGLSGMVVAERIASRRNEPVLIIDKRPHIGGNIYDERDAATGVTVHRYGPHVFHTNNKQVWEYLSRFTEWHPFMYRVKAVVDGTEVPVPFNLDSLHALFPRTMAVRMEENLIDAFGFNTDVPILRLRETRDADLKLLADFIYEKIFAGYTAKQWGLTAEQLDPSVSGRVPVRVGRDNRYFRDTYQAIPSEGYTAMARRIIDHPLIEVRLNTDFREIREEISYDRIFYTGPIDEFFDYKYGHLPYRSLNFVFRNLPCEYAQSGPQINYPCNYDYTRSVEYKYYLDEKTPHTTISHEYPCAHEPGRNEPYYPIPAADNTTLYERYIELARSHSNVYFLGRLGTYRYLNMDQAVSAALNSLERRWESPITSNKKEAIPKNMKLKKIRIKNFRGYNGEIDVSIGDMTAFVGPNDAGKSTILEALDIFFNDSGGVVKMGKNDLNVKQKGGDGPEVEIACVFSDLPETIAIDSSNGTSLNLKQNYMLNSDGLLEIVKKYSMTSESPRATVSIKALHPGNPNCSNLLSKTQEELRGILDQFNISCDDRRKCSSMRSAIWEHFSNNLGLQEGLIDIPAKSGQGSDSVWNCLKRVLPVYSLFQSDRKNSDGDSEVQDPLREAVKEILRDEEIQNKLDDVAEKVRARLRGVAISTLAKLEEMNPDVVKTLKPQIPSTGDLKWADVFKGLSITGDENIPINKRGSGVRRLVLINFFRAEVESKAERTNSSVIYAIEEPETSQHVQNQKKLVSALKELSKKFHTQIILTTHSSTVVRCLDYEDIRIVNGDHSISAIQSEGRNTKTLLEVNYLAFGDATAEYHDELYDEIQKKLGVDTVSGFEGKVKEKKIFDAYMKRHNGLTGEDEILTLQSYIRNCIHHPGNSRKPEYTPAQITQSIVEMRRCLGEQHDNEQQSNDHQPEMGK